MEIFYNSERPGYDEIVSYGPKWWTEYREMDANYRYAGWTLDLMAHFLERTVKNQFPSQADEMATLMYERLLRIEHDTELSLEERKRIVSAYYSGTGHLSKSVIETLVKAYTGQDGNVFWDNGVLCIEFNNNDGLFVSIGILQKVIERRIPAHIPFQTRCTCRVSLELGAVIEPWEMLFTLAGTKPKTNYGLSIAQSEIELKTEITALQFQNPVSGDGGKAGEFPKTSVELEATDNSTGLSAKTESWSVRYPVCGDSLTI